jgi:hypothetical protein
MTLQELRSYYNLRQYQISHLLNAQEFHKLCSKGKNCDLQLWLYLFYWADAMYEADGLWQKLGNTDAYWKSRGKL